MQTKKARTITRRTLVAGAAAGTLALAADPASAQRCPATPPARAKGPAIWLDYDQHDMDEMYDQSVYAFNQKAVLARSDANNVIATATIGVRSPLVSGTLLNSTLMKCAPALTNGSAW